MTFNIPPLRPRILRQVITDGAGCYPWHEVFAWRPVYTVSGQRVWFKNFISGECGFAFFLHRLLLKQLMLSMLKNEYNMLYPLTYLRTRIKAWKDDWFLKKHHCNSWEQYNRHYDPDINWRSSRVRDFYHGYPFFYCFENRQHDVYSWDSLENLQCWAETNCQHKYRIDIFRVIKCPATSNQWKMDDLGGSDYIFIAFKNEHDAFKFMLKWA